MSQTLLEKLQFKEEKSLLIQGLPSSIEKQFSKLAFAKNVTPLLRIKKIDFALVFAVNEQQLQGIINEVIPALHHKAKLWVAYPKAASKIATTLNRDCSWECLTRCGFESVQHVPLDHVWTALYFQKAPMLNEKATQTISVTGGYAVSLEMVEQGKKLINPPEDFVKELKRSKAASHFFDKLSVSNKKEYVSWISKAKKVETRSRRLEVAIDKLIAGKSSPGEL
jgi:Bacteriocin-protection, YdeI or OmpD-Associated